MNHYIDGIQPLIFALLLFLLLPRSNPLHPPTKLFPPPVKHEFSTVIEVEVVEEVVVAVIMVTMRHITSSSIVDHRRRGIFVIDVVKKVGSLLGQRLEPRNDSVANVHSTIPLGHWIQECPTNEDPDWENKPRFKRTTGIPKKFLTTVEQPKGADGDTTGVMVTSDGSFVMAQPDT